MIGSNDSQKEANKCSNSSVCTAHGSILCHSKGDSSGGSPSKKVASAYGSSFESSATKYSTGGTSKSRRISHIELFSTFEETERPPEKCLSAWEKWLCSKEEEKRKHLLQLNEQRRQKEIEEKIIEEKKLERRFLAEAAHKKWLKRVEGDHKRQMKIKREKTEQERMMKEEKEKKIKEIAPQKHHDWMARKEKLKEEKKREEKLKDQVTVERLEKKKQLNEEAFKKWLKEVSKRPKSQNSVGYGYAGGILIKMKGAIPYRFWGAQSNNDSESCRLALINVKIGYHVSYIRGWIQKKGYKGYHDGTSPPKPSYCNPKPWVHSTENDDK